MEYICNNKKIILPEKILKSKNLPNIPENSECIYLKTNEAKFIGFVYPLEEKRVMPLDDKNIIINTIHNVLKENQGIIEVNNGLTKNNNKYSYSIVKTHIESIGIDYFLCIHLKIDDSFFGINLHCSEIGRTGQRESIIMNETILNNNTQIDMSKWSKDPYTDDYKKGLLMNLSEQKEYDTRFPKHPLSFARNFVEFIINNN